MSLDEAIGSLKIHKDKLQDCEEERERAFMVSVKGKSKERRRRRHKRENRHEGERKKKDRDKVKCFNYHRYGHYTTTCRGSNDQDKTLVKRRRKLRVHSYKKWWKIAQTKD